MIFLLFFACSSSSSIEEKRASLDLSSPLNENQVRLGVIEDESALFGGISAEGQLGDYKIYNNQVQFVIQSDRDSSYYVQHGGGIIDADIIRDPQSEGRDIIDEHTFMAGFARILNPTSFEILSDGSDGVAHLRVTGDGAPFELLQGALEQYNLVPTVDMTFQVDYRLQPNSHFLEMHVQVHWEDDPTSIQMANAILIAKEVTDVWSPGTGYNNPGESEWVGAISNKNEVALGIFPVDLPFTPSVVQELLEEETPAISAFGPHQSVAPGETVGIKYHVGLAHDLASLTDAWQQQAGVVTEPYGGTVVGSLGEMVAGARVQIFTDDTPFTMALTDENGQWKADIPSGAEVSFIASGRLSGIHDDLPAGAGWYSPYAVDSIRNQSLLSLELGGAEIPFAEGYGVGQPNEDTLISPGTLEVDLQDGLAAVVKLYFVNGDPVPSNWSLRRPHGAAAIAYSRTGRIAFPVEPGEYNVVILRGSDYSAHQETVSITSGARTTIVALLEKQQLPANIYTIDPHSHSSPSGDGRVSMTGRALSHAAHGVDIHVSTEHDHIIDFQPLIDGLGLSAQLQTVIGSEVSPTLRGHFNIFPLEPDADILNFGSPIWWDMPRDTPELFELIRSVLPDNGLIQANHPTGSSGLFRLSGYEISSGTVYSTTHWSNDFNLVELLNDGRYSAVLPYYFDLISRGHKLTPIGVSDSHSSENGVGINRTYVYANSKATSDIMDALGKQQTVVSRGPYIHATIGGSWAPGKTFVGAQSLDVRVYKQDWMDVTDIVLYENGEEKERVPYESEVRFMIEPSSDAYYTVEVDGLTSMSPFYFEEPWAMTAAFYIDTFGDGWTPLLPPIE